MKTSRLLIVVITLTFILTGCGKKKAVPSRAAKLQEEAHQIELAMQKSVADSQVIVYAKAYTNNAPELLLSILEIWKGENEASNLGITNDSQLPFRWPANLGPLPDDAIIFIPPGTTRSNLQFGAGTTFFRPGKTNGMTAQGYKTWIDKLLPPGAAPHNVIRFTVQVTNNCMKTADVPAQMTLQSGFPGYIAISVDETNYLKDAVWSNYTSANVTVKLGQTEGWHQVWIGLRGHADPVSAAVWRWARLKLDFTPPQLVITNPVASVVNKPVIQLQGFANEALQAISYDITNASGLSINQQMMVIGQTYSTSTAEFTTNYFQAYDVPLTNGLNVITLHATDRAGNATTTNFSFTLDYSAKTNPPVVQLIWPQDGMEIVGKNIVCHGQLSDDTATVMVQLVDANGVTNSVGSLVGRDGEFYAGNLNLAAGTNYLSYTVTDAAGNVVTTNITVSTSDLRLTMDPVAAGQTVATGTIDREGYTIYVNGVEASMTNGIWRATITPIGVRGGAVVVNAVKNRGDPSLQQIILNLTRQP